MWLLKSNVVQVLLILIMCFIFFFLAPLLAIDYIIFLDKQDSAKRHKIEAISYRPINYNEEFYLSAADDKQIIILEKHKILLYNIENQNFNYFNIPFNKCNPFNIKKIQNNLFLIDFYDCESKIWNKDNNSYENAFNIDNLENPILLNRNNKDSIIVYNTNISSGILTYIGLWNPEQKIHKTFLLPHYLRNYTATLLNDDKILIAGGQETTDSIELDEDCLPTCQAKIVGMFDNDYLPESFNNFGYIFNINTKNMTKTALLSEKLAFSPNNVIKISDKNQIGFILLGDSNQSNYIYNYNIQKNTWTHGKDIHKFYTTSFLEKNKIILLEKNKILASYDLIRHNPINTCLPKKYLDSNNKPEDCSRFIKFPKTIIVKNQIIRVGARDGGGNDYSFIAHYKISNTPVKNEYYLETLWQRTHDYWQNIFRKTYRKIQHYF